MTEHNQTEVNYSFTLHQHIQSVEYHTNDLLNNINAIGNEILAIINSHQSYIPNKVYQCIMAYQNAIQYLAQEKYAHLYFIFFRINNDTKVVYELMQSHGLLRNQVHWDWLKIIDFINCIQSYAITIRPILSQNQHRRFVERSKVLRNYIDGLFHKHSKLLIVRLDLSYQKEYRVDFDTFNTEFKSFIRKFENNKLFANLKGYIWKIEYGIERGLHVHLMLFYDGQKHMQDINIAKLVGETWIQHTDACTGSYFNVNHIKEKYDDIGVGLITRQQYFEDKTGVLKTADYLMKEDHYANLLPMNKRVWGKGQSELC